MNAPLRAAMVRPTTLDPSLWPRAVRALASLGFNAIDVPLVWREHETAVDRFDFNTGARDIRRFLDLVAAEGLRAVVRLGPWPTPDVEGLGLPERVLRDRACQARTKRQSPVYVFDLPSFAPLPSLASARYRAACGAWIAAAAAALKGHDLARVFVGHAVPAVLRDDPFEADHHPDARAGAPAVEPPHGAPPDAALAEVERQRDHARDFLLGLRDAAVAGGLDVSRVGFCVSGGVGVSPLAVALAPVASLCVPAPPPRAGATGIWQQVRFARALSSATHVDLRVGAAPFEPPTRATHTLQAARIALAAGASDVTVQMGCSGHGWIGALLDERAEPRPHAARWSALLAWAEALPSGEERGVALGVRAHEVTARRAATGVHPLPSGLLAWVGMRPEELVAEAFHASDEATQEAALYAKGVPCWTRVVEHGDAAGELDALASAWASLTPRVSPQGAALVRVVAHPKGRALVVCSRAEGPIRVAPPEGGRWLDAQGVVEGERALPGGEVLVLHEANV